MMATESKSFKELAAVDSERTPRHAGLERLEIKSRVARHPLLRRAH